MHLVRDVMSHSVVYVTRDATVRTAVELLLAHQMHAVPVVHEGQVIALLDALTLSIYDGEVFVEEAVREHPITVEADMPLAEAAMRMRAAKVRQVPVLQEGRLVGLLTDRDLLTVWGAASDPLTGLPVQHRLRRWASLALSGGQEVVVLFLDLDNFGLLNKQYGHVVGDQVLQHVAEVLREECDPDTDFVCRYGGDEFAVASTRRPGAARELAARIRGGVSRIRLNEEPGKVAVSIGLAGGQRLQPRQGVHVSAMLDDLLTRASTASTAAKHTPEHVCSFQGAQDQPPSAGNGGPTSPLAPRLVVAGYRLGQVGDQVEVTVILRRGDELREARVLTPEGEALRAVAGATTECLRLFLAGTPELRLEEVYEYSTQRGLACVGVTVVAAPAGGPSERLVGAAALREDTGRSYINAVLDAVNRRMALLASPRTAG
jgi:IMP dehydrogenase